MAHCLYVCLSNLNEPKEKTLFLPKTQSSEEVLVMWSKRVQIITQKTVPASFTKLYKHAHVINQPDDVNSIKTLLWKKALISLNTFC